MDLNSVSTVDGPLPILVVVAGLVSIPVSIGWRGHRSAWRRQLLIGIPVTAALVAATAALVDGFALIPYQFPNSYYLWVGLALFAVVICVLGWLGAPWWRRILSVLSIALTSLMAFALINAHYQYWPTIGSLFGQEAENQVDSAELRAAQADYRRTRQLPDHGFTLTMHIPATASGFDARDAYVWLPPIWVSSPTPRLPVIEMLHGFPGSPSDWTRAGFADDTARAFAVGNRGRAPILVMPDATGSQNADTECVNSLDGKAETYLTVDVLAFVRATFGAATGPESTAIAGLSMGGMCATMLTLRHPDIYHTFADYSGLSSPSVGSTVDPATTIRELFGGSASDYAAHDPLSLLAGTSLPQLGGWFAVGTGDATPLQSQRTVVSLARRAGIRTCAFEGPGAHDFDFWSSAFTDSLPWMSYRLGLLSTEPVTNAQCSG